MRFACLIVVLSCIWMSCQSGSQPTTDTPATPITASNSSEPPVLAVDPIVPTAPNSVPLDPSSLAPPEQLVTAVQGALMSGYNDWVLFQHGTYIVFDNIDTISDVVQAAQALLQQYRPKRAMDTNWSVSVTDLDQVEGWSVFGNGYGIYTLVHGSELPGSPSPQQIGAFGKAKRALDEQNPQVAYVSSASGISKVF